MRITEAEACELAKQHKGITVNRRRRYGFKNTTWAYYARLMVDGHRHSRYAGKNLERAIALRSEMETRFLRKNQT